MPESSAGHHSPDIGRRRFMQGALVATVGFPTIIPSGVPGWAPGALYRYANRLYAAAGPT